MMSSSSSAQSGTPEYADQFATWSDAGNERRSRKCVTVIGRDEAASDRERLQVALTSAKDGNRPLWLVLIGHGTFDGRDAKFNLRGPDVSDEELADWLKPLQPAARGDRLLVGQRAVPQQALRRRPRDRSPPPRAARRTTSPASATRCPRPSPTIAADLDKDGQTSLPGGLPRRLPPRRGVLQAGRPPRDRARPARRQRRWSGNPGG